MGDLEGIAAQAVEEVAGNRFARGKTDAVHEAVELGPYLRQVGEQLLDLGIVADIAVEHQAGAEVCGKFGDAVLEALAHVAEGQLGALLMTGLGNTVGNRAVGEHAGNQQFLAGQETHGILPLVMSEWENSGNRAAPMPAEDSICLRARVCKVCIVAWPIGLSEVSGNAFGVAGHQKHGVAATQWRAGSLVQRARLGYNFVHHHQACTQHGPVFTRPFFLFMLGNGGLAA